MKNLLAAIVVSALTTLAVVMLVPQFAPSPAVGPAAKTETAYERVMRTGVLRCGYSPWPPYWDVDPNTKEVKGLSKDMSDAAARLAGLKIEYVEIVLGQAVQDLESGKIDATCGDGPWMMSTIKYLDYSKAYDFGAVYAYGRADDVRFKILDDLNDESVTFTGIDGDLSSDLVTSNFPKAKINTLAALTDSAQLLLNVATGKADAAIIDSLSVAIFSNNNPGQLKKLVDQPVAIYGAGFAVKKGEANLLNTLNEAVNAVINTGAAARILKKYDPDGQYFLPAATPYQSPKG